MVKGVFMWFISIFSREVKIMKKHTTRYLAYVAVLTAMAFGLMVFPHLPILPAPANFLKLDFADVPVVFAGLIFGPIAAVITAGLKIALYLICGFSDTLGVGELSNLIVSLTFALTISILFNIKRNKITLLIAFVSSIVVVICVAMFSNKFIIVPLYIRLLELPQFLVDYVLSDAYILGAVPLFNFIKFELQALIGFMLYKSLEKVLPKFSTCPKS